MRRVLLAGLMVAACSAPAASDVDQASAEVRSDPTDPMVHLTVIASPEMNGRGTPSAGLDRAADYVAGECARAGAAGGLGEGIYKQPWVLGGFHDASAVEVEHDLGTEPFEGGVFLSGDLAPDTQAEMARALCTRGACPAADADPRDAFRAAAQTTNNVVALLPGTGAHKEEIVLLSAHLDHLGAGFPGADDNGSGSAALVAIMHRLAKQPLDRTVAFLWTAGEEKGLLGSAYFVDNPPPSVPLGRIAQAINLDAVGALDDTRFSILPDGTARTQATVSMLTASSGEMNRPFARMNQDVQAYARRTDAYSFVRKNVPTIWVFEGLTNPNGGGTLMPRYHKPTDTVANLLADNGGSKIRRMTEMLARTVVKVANATF